MQFLKISRWKPCVLAVDKEVRVCMGQETDEYIIFNQIRKLANINVTPETTALSRFKSDAIANAEYAKRCSLLKTESLPFLWTQKDKIGIDFLDQEHEKFFDSLNAIADHCTKTGDVKKCPTLLVELVNLIKEHIKHEEEEMEKTNFPLLIAHQQAHKEILVSIKTLFSVASRDKVGMLGLCQQLALVLLQHFHRADKAFAEHLDTMNSLDVQIDIEN